MRYAYLVVLISMMLFTTPALAVDNIPGTSDGKAKYNDSRRPDLGIVRRERPAPAEEVHPPAGDSTWEEFYVADVDTAAFMDRLYDVMTREEWLGQFPEVASVADYMKTAGFFNLNHLHEEYSITGDSMNFRFTQNYSDLDPESYYAKMMSLPDAELRSAAHITDDYLLYFAVNNLTDMVLLELEQMMASQKMIETLGGEMDGMEDLSQAMGMLEAFQIDQIAKNVITGELAIVLYGLPPLNELMEGDVEPADFDVAIMIGIQDSEYLAGMIDQYGSEIGLLGREFKGDDWNYYVMQGEESLGLMFSDELLIVTADIDTARDHVMQARKNGGLGLGACQSYMGLNCNELRTTIIEPLAGVAMQEIGEDIKLPVEPLGYLFNISEETDLGKLELETRYMGDGTAMECRMNKAMVQYLAYALGITACGAAQSGAF